MPDWICSWFGLPAISEALLRAAFKRRGVAAPELLVQAGRCQAVLRVLPQGWSWSVFLAQLCHQELLRKATAAPVISDRLPDHDFGEEPLAVVAYVDDGGAMGTAQEEVN